MEHTVFHYLECGTPCVPLPRHKDMCLNSSDYFSKKSKIIHIIIYYNNLIMDNGYLIVLSGLLTGSYIWYKIYNSRLVNNCCYFFSHILNLDQL